MGALPQPVADDIAFHLDAIAAHFKAPMITLLIRPDVDEGLDADCVMTNDDLRLAIEALELRHAIGPIAT